MPTHIAKIIDKSAISVELASGWKRRGYTMIGNKVVHNPDLSLQAKGLYWYLYSMCFKKDACYTSYDYISKNIKISRNSVHKYLAELRDAGYLIVKRRGQGRTNKYILKF